MICQAEQPTWLSTCQFRLELRFGGCDQCSGQGAPNRRAPQDPEQDAQSHGGAAKAGGAEPG